MHHRAQPDETKVPWLFTLLLTGFIFCYTVGPRFSGLVLAAQFLGLAMGVAVAIRWIRTGVQIPLQIGLLALFVVWAVGTGGVLATDHGLYLGGVERMLEIFLLSVCVAAIAAKCRTPIMGFLAITGLGLIFACYSLVVGDFARAQEFSQQGERLVGYRASSLAYNPNTLGVFCALGLPGLALLWRRATRLWQSAVLVGLGLLLLAGAVYSGSLKALVLVPVFLAAWGWFCYRQLFFRKAAVFISVAIAITAVAVGISFVLRETYSGYRLRAVFSGESKDPSTDLRLSMIEEGLEMVKDHPLAGVGLYQFAARSSHRTYAHNDYVEVAATTGLIGLGIYLSVFALAAWRLFAIRRFHRGTEAAHVAGVCLAVLITCGVAAFAIVCSCSIEFWCFISGVFGFTSAAWRETARLSVGHRSRNGSARRKLVMQRDAPFRHHQPVRT